MNTLIIFLHKSRNTWMIRTLISARNFCPGQLNSLQNAGNNTEIKPLRRAANYSGSTHSGAFTLLPTNRAKPEPFDKTNAGNPHKYRFSAFLSVIQTPLRTAFHDTQRLLLETYTSNMCSDFVLFAQLMKK